jgi:hypothetical protein
MLRQGERAWGAAVQEEPLLLHRTGMEGARVASAIPCQPPRAAANTASTRDVTNGSLPEPLN